MDVFDDCGLQVLSETDATNMLRYFKEFNDTYDPSKAIGPSEIFLSKTFLQNILDRMPPEQNCLRLRLGLTKPTTHRRPVYAPWYRRLWVRRVQAQSDEVPLSWIMQPVQAMKTGNNKFEILQTGDWLGAPGVAGTGVGTNPPEIGVPPYEQ